MDAFVGRLTVLGDPGAGDSATTLSLTLRFFSCVSRLTLSSWRLHEGHSDAERFGVDVAAALPRKAA